MSGRELEVALRALSKSASSVKAAAQAALQLKNDFKQVVYDVEQFTWRSDAKKRIAGLFVMDAIVRQDEKSKQPLFAARFAKRMDRTVAALREIPSQDAVSPAMRSLSSSSSVAA